MDQKLIDAVKKFDIKNPLSTAGLVTMLSELNTSTVTLAESQHMPAALIKNLYDLGIYFYNLQKYEVASKALELIVLLDNTNPAYSFAAGACQQARGDFLAAIAYYTMSANHDKENPLPIFYAAEATFALKKNHEAKYFYEQAAQLAKNNPQFEALLSQVKLRLEMIKSA